MSRTSSGTEAPDDPIAVLLGEMLQHLAAAQSVEVERRAEIGRILGELKKAMGHGEWLFFVADELPFSSATVKRAIQLHAFRKTQPSKFAMLVSLGLTKAYRLMATTPTEWEAFFGKPQHAVRRNVMKTPLQMTFAEMVEVIQGPPKKVAASVKMVKAVKRFAKGLLSSVSALLELPEMVALANEESEELMDSLDTIADETKRVVALLPQALAAG